MPATLILVRHGQTSWNREERFRGHADVPLDEVGFAQARRTGEYIGKNWKVAAVYAGPLSRTVKTGEAIARPAGLPVQVEPALIDVDCGQWEGLTLTEVQSRWPQEAEEWLQAPERLRFPGGETLDEAQARAVAGVHALLAAHSEETIALVSHTALNRLLLLSFMGLPLGRFWDLRQDTCGVSVIEARLGSYCLAMLNATAHLSCGESTSDSARGNQTI